MPARCSCSARRRYNGHTFAVAGSTRDDDHRCSRRTRNEPELAAEPARADVEVDFLPISHHYSLLGATVAEGARQLFRTPFIFGTITATFPRARR